MTGFDPYHKWLGIPPKDQPPNHYRLLAIELFESDPDVIASAADQRMAHVRSFQTGKNSELSQQVLNEISAARICLLAPEKKEQYDQQLRAQLAQAGVPPVLPKAPAAALAAPRAATAASVVPDAESPELAFIAARAESDPLMAQKARKQFYWRVFGVVAVLLILSSASLAIWVIRASFLDKSPPDEVVLKTSNSNDVPKNKTGSTAPKESSAPETPKQSKPESDIPPQPPAKPITRSKPPTPNDPSKSKPKPGDPPQPLPVLQLSNEKWEVPSAEALQQALASVRDRYKDDYKKSEKPADKKALAKKLLQKAAETRNDPATRYVLYQEAMTMAVEGSQGELAFQVIDAMVYDYNTSAADLKEGVLQQGAKMVRTPEQRHALVEEVLNVMDEAVGEENFAAARQLSKLATTQARLLKDPSLNQDLNANNKELSAATAARAAVENALTKLAETPADPEANGTAGKYFCFRKGEWEKGLPMLALCNNTVIKGLAERDLKNPTAADEQQKLGDDWWQYAPKEAQKEEDALKQRRIQERAAYWYQQALIQSTGLQREKLSEKMELMDPNTLPSGKWVNLLKYIKPETDRMFGEWSKLGSTLTVTAPQSKEAQGAPRIALPVEFDGAYDFQLIFTRQSLYVDGASICAVLPAGQASFMLVLDTGKEHYSGIEHIDGRGIKDNPTMVRSVMLPSGRPFTAQVSVRPTQDTVSISVQLDGKPMIHWEGKQSSLGLNSRWALTAPRRLGIGAEQSAVVFQEASLRMISGKAFWSPLRSLTYLTALPLVQSSVWSNPGMSPLEMAVSPSVRYRGKQVQHGLWARPFTGVETPSQITYNLKQDFRQLAGTAAIADNGNPGAPLVFRVVGDNKLLWKSRPLQKGGESEPFRVVVSGVTRLDLFVDCPGSSNVAHALWVDPMLNK
jgi:hypothetical protein